LAVGGDEGSSIDLKSPQVVAQLRQFRLRGQRRIKTVFNLPGTGAKTKPKFGGQAGYFARRHARYFLESRRQIPYEPHRAGVENAIRAWGMNQDDDFVRETEIFADDLVENDFGRTGRDQCVSVGF